MKRKIGQASIEYNNGNVVKASFTPTLQVDFQQSFLEQLKSHLKVKDSEAIQYNTDLVLAGWFNTITNIELADREELQIISENVECDKDLDGYVTLCVLDYYVVTKDTE
jgi:hypothetical protein